MLNKNFLISFIVIIFFVKKAITEEIVKQNNSHALFQKISTTKKPATFCNDYFKNYSLVSTISIKSASRYQDIGVMRNGSFYLVKCNLDENNMVNGFTIGYFNKQGSLKFSKQTDLNLNEIENGAIRMAIDNKGFIYLYIGRTIRNDYQQIQKSYLFKLNQLGELIIAKNGTMTSDGYLSYSKQDKLLYIKSGGLLLAVETERLSILFKRKLPLPMYGTQFLSGRPGMLYAFDGLSLIRYDVVRDELNFKRVKKSPYSSDSDSATMVSQCILVALSEEYLNATQSRMALNVIQLDKKKMFDIDITNYNFWNSAMTMRATADNKIYMFDNFYNKLYVFYY